MTPDPHLGPFWFVRDRNGNVRLLAHAIPLTAAESYSRSGIHHIVADAGYQLLTAPASTRTALKSTFPLPFARDQAKMRDKAFCTFAPKPMQALFEHILPRTTIRTCCITAVERVYDSGALLSQPDTLRFERYSSKVG